MKRENGFEAGHDNYYGGRVALRSNGMGRQHRTEHGYKVYGSMVHGHGQRGSGALAAWFRGREMSS